MAHGGFCDVCDSKLKNILMPRGKASAIHSQTLRGRVCASPGTQDIRLKVHTGGIYIFSSGE